MGYDVDMNYKYNCDECLHEAVCKFKKENVFSKLDDKLYLGMLTEKDFDITITCKNFIPINKEEGK